VTNFVSIMLPPLRVYLRVPVDLSPLSASGPDPPFSNKFLLSLLFMTLPFARRFEAPPARGQQSHCGRSVSHLFSDGARTLGNPLLRGGLPNFNRKSVLILALGSFEEVSCSRESEVSSIRNSSASQGCPSAFCFY